MKIFIKLFCLIYFLTFLNTNGQNYLISFAGSGAATNVSTVKVENLTKGTTLTLNGGDILRLNAITGIYSAEDNQSSEMKIYPNPMTNNSSIVIYPPVKGEAIISVLDIGGKQVAQIQSYLENDKQEFRLSGLINGFYIINIKGKTYQLSGKLLCQGNSMGHITIEKVSNPVNQDKEKTQTEQRKGLMATVDMQYTPGDRFKFSAITGNFSTVLTEIPAQDKILTFNFIACSDADNNNYPVVKIRTQTWMEENLKTTKFRDGSSIPLIVSNAEWANLTTAGYCWYNNDQTTYKPRFGALYNWYVLNSGEVCPSGWHLPTSDEWTILTTFLGGEDVAGGKLKETGTELWLSPNSGATNETGFTALPGDARYLDGTFKFFGSYCHWWSSTEFDANNSWLRYLMNDWEGVANINADKNYGLSVRCLLNTLTK